MTDNVDVVHSRRVVLSRGQPAARPTMRTIADRVGVSVKSVSRVLNGEPGASPATAQHIRKVARDLGFRRNDLARDLRRGARTGTIGVVVRRSSTRFYDDLIRGVEDVADRRKALVITAGSRSPDRERETLLALSARRVDGLLIMPSGPDHSFLATEQAMGMPVVFVDRPPHHLVADTILADDRAGARRATTHLIEHGHHRIGLIVAAPALHTMRERQRGYGDALRAAGVPVDDGLVRLDRHTYADAAAAVAELLAAPDPPTALFTLTNVATVAAVRALRGAGLEHRVAVVGFDDFDLADLLTPPVTVVAHDVTEMGRTAAERLFARLDGDDTPPRTITLPCTLVPRGSGETAL
jgi:LacI family transcriptional regulator